MSLAYDPSDRTISSVHYVVNTTGDRWFIPTTGYADNPNAGTTAQQLVQCNLLVGYQTDGTTPLGAEVVAS